MHVGLSQMMKYVQKLSLWLSGIIHHGLYLLTLCVHVDDISYHNFKSLITDCSIITFYYRVTVLLESIGVGINEQ